MQTVLGLLLTLAVAVFLSHHTQAQDILSPSSGLIKPAADAQPLVVPKTAAVGVPPAVATAAEAAAIRPEVAATTGT